MRNLTAAALALLLGLGLGCPRPATTGSGTADRRDAKEEQLLSTSARMYWEGVRWADGARSVEFIEDPSNRLAYEDWLKDERESHRLVDVKIVQIQLGPEYDPPREGRSREAVVHIRTEGYSLPAQILEDERVTQNWYRTMQGWYVEWQPDTPQPDWETQ